MRDIMHMLLIAKNFSFIMSLLVLDGSHNSESFHLVQEVLGTIFLKNQKLYK